MQPFGYEMLWNPYNKSLHIFHFILSLSKQTKIWDSKILKGICSGRRIPFHPNLISSATSWDTLKHHLHFTKIIIFSSVANYISINKYWTTLSSHSSLARCLTLVKSVVHKTQQHWGAIHKWRHLWNDLGKQLTLRLNSDPTVKKQQKPDKDFFASKHYQTELFKGFKIQNVSENFIVKILNKLGRITWPRFAIRQKLTASGIIHVWTYEEVVRVTWLEPESNISRDPALPKFDTEPFCQALMYSLVYSFMHLLMVVRIELFDFDSFGAGIYLKLYKKVPRLEAIK